MTMFHKALAAALLSGAVGFGLPSYAAGADYSSSPAATPTDKGSTTAPSSTAATSSEKGSANAADTSTPAKPAKRVARVRAEAARAAKTVDRHRANTKANVKKGA